MKTIPGNKHSNYVDSSYFDGLFNTHRSVINAAVAFKGEFIFNCIANKITIKHISICI